jgi:hypothetical protein
MGFFDKIKKGLDNVTKAPAPAPQAPPPPEEEEAEEEQASQVVLDLAGFDPRDENAFFEAVLHMESEGEMGGTDQSRADIMRRYGIRDRSHWQTVKDSVYHVLMQTYGSIEEVSQREMNWRMGQMQRGMQAKMAAAAAGGGFDPVEGVTLQAWAAFNAAIMGGGNLDDLLKGAGIDRARWDRVSAEWNARMARDTTFAITTVYGNAFQAASQGKYGAYAREANAARAANRDLGMPPPITLEQFWDIMYAQAYATKQGQDAAEALKAMGLSIVDWTDLGSYMGYYFHRTGVAKWKEYEAIHKQVLAKWQAKHPGVKPDVDIQF